jgi:lipoate-protein ligase A
VKSTGDVKWRLIDTGARSAAENIALDAALLDLRAAGKIENTLRFLSFTPGAALIGLHQSAKQELRLDYCEANGIDINRRITGGGAVFFDATQIGWEIIAGRGDIDCGATMAHLTRYICEAAADGLRLLGIPASFRPRNDIEVGGRKISGSGGAWEGDAFLFQGTLLVDFDIATMLRALRVPTEKLSRHDLETAADRVTSVAECLPGLPSHEEIKQALVEGFAGHLGIELSPSVLTPEEEELTAARLQHYSSDEWLGGIEEPTDCHQVISTVQVADSGTIRTTVAFDVPRERVKSVLFSGDFFIKPYRAVHDLENSLRSCDCDAVESTIQAFFAQHDPDALGLGAADFHAGIESARRKLSFTDQGLCLDEVGSVTMMGADPQIQLSHALPDVGAVLLPYCAKLPDCDFRNREGCDQCGDCTVGDAYAIAQCRGLTPVTIQSYEHLEQVFTHYRSSGVTSYIGCCCQAFMVKRHEAFRHAGMTGVLIDIDDDTCYDLSRESEAYAGRFTGHTSLKSGILEKLMAHVPVRKTKTVAPDGSTAEYGFSGR